jgi:glycosyltransferase involved in cell wall biosynthesis
MFPQCPQLDPASEGATRRPVLWGTSFDATVVSGVVVEFLKLARVFRERRHQVLLDLGYDIKEDKHHFLQAYSDERASLPPWVELVRVDDISHIDGYGPEFVRAMLAAVGTGAPLPPETDTITSALADRIVANWRRYGVTIVVVENGTLPENVAYTRALYQAIEVYGREQRFGAYVLWRDHDLMWSSEPGTGKYGTFPYPHAVRPVNSSHIRYLALHDKARVRTLEWVPELRGIRTLPNTFTFTPATLDEHSCGFRAHYGIPGEAKLVARYTRIIPPKRIDRDIELIARLNRLVLARVLDHPVYLFVAGDPSEDHDESKALHDQARRLGVADRVIFGGRLAPRDFAPAVLAGTTYSVQDLLANADVASFLTSYDYESYGNPIGEAIAARVPYLSTRYQLYDTVYGHKGFHAPVLEISDADEHLPDAFVAEVAELLTNPLLHRRVVDFNYARGRRYFATSRSIQVVDELLAGRGDPSATGAATGGLATSGAVGPAVPDVYGPVARAAVPSLQRSTRMSVVLPVFNEAANIAAVLDSLVNQCDDHGLLDRSLFDVLVVDNNSTDDTVALCRQFAGRHQDLDIHVIGEAAQGVSCARKAGMDLAAERARLRSHAEPDSRPFYLVSADADCRVAPRWLAELLAAMEGSKAAIGVCNYYYDAEHFAGRPLLWDAIERTLRCRAVTFQLFGGFPDGKGFAVEREAYERVGGIELSYQVRDGRFVNHLSDDWDFGILVRARGGDITYVSSSRVEINPRRVDHAIDEVIAGRAYGAGGIITMRDIRPQHPTDGMRRDLAEPQAVQAWDFSIKDFVPKNMILPVLLTPSLLDDDAVVEFFTASLAARLRQRIAEIKTEMRILDLAPIHSYKTPSFRLYFEFTDELFARLRAAVGPDIGYPPPLPACLQEIRDQGDPERFRDFVRYYCEDRESGEAHDYFGNGGVF